MFFFEGLYPYCSLGTNPGKIRVYNWNVVIGTAEKNMR